MAFDYIFKRVMEDMLRSCGAKAEKVGILPLEIDSVVRCKPGQQVDAAIPLLVSHFSTDNLLEYKSERENVGGEALAKLLGYVGLYCDQHGIGIHEIQSRVTATFITARRLEFLDTILASKHAAPTRDPGVYEMKTGFPCPCRVIVRDELVVNDGNIPLLLLGSVSTIRKGISQLARAGAELRHDMETIITTIFLSYYDKVKDMTEMNEILPADVRQSMKHAIEDLGLEEMIEEIGIEKVEAALTKVKANRRSKKSK
nr:hypothetical protein [Candidatus Sigynarchaeota archaeon]